MRILHLIAGLKEGGAETSLMRLVNHDKKNDHYVVSLLPLSNLQYDTYKSIQVSSLNIDNKYLHFFKIVRLIKIVKHINPDVMQTWMFYSNLIGGLIAIFCNVKNVIWCLHSQSTKEKRFPYRVKLVSFFCKILSNKIPSLIVCCSESVKKSHLAFGYPTEKTVVIENGLNFNIFKKIEIKELNLKIKYHLNNSNEVFTIGMVSRWDIFKDHQNLFKALSEIKKDKLVNFRLILAGNNINSSNKQLIRSLNKNDIADETILLDHIIDIHQLYNILDLTVLSSFSEALPTVLIESMACETPCVASDVGDTRLIVSKFGWISKLYEYISLKNNILKAYNLKLNNIQLWNVNKIRCRQHVKSLFDINIISKKFNQIWKMQYLENEKNKYLLENFNNDFCNNLSIVITSVGFKCVVDTVKNLNKYDYKPKEIIICIPKEDRHKIVSLAEFNNIKIISCDLKGQVAQRLIGFLNVKYDYVLHLDDDCIINPNDIIKMINLMKELGINNAIAPTYFDSSTKKPLHRLSYGSFGFLKDIVSYFLFATPLGRKKMGKLSKKIGINYGVDYNALKKNFTRVDWLPGGCVLHNKKNLILIDYFPFQGKAYCEDLIHSYFLQDKQIKLWVNKDSKCFTPKPKFPKSYVEVIKYTTAFKYYNSLKFSKSFRMNIWYFYTLYIRRFFSL